MTTLLSHRGFLYSITLDAKKVFLLNTKRSWDVETIPYTGYRIARPVYIF
ncbi:hypothetical protein IX326_001587 [Porphyromonas levii]|nr:hypothetical protein [Porphyromonas levii]